MYYLTGIMFFTVVSQLGYCTSNNVYTAYRQHRSTHAEAGAFCRERGGQLATIADHNDQENMEIHLRSSGDNFSSVTTYWIGAALDFIPELTWVDGTEYSGMSDATCWCLCRQT